MKSASFGGGDMDKVWEIKTLGKARDAEAKKMLENVAKQVQPIMRKHSWRVMLLSEFSPKNPSLLGLNIGGGREVRIRLRPHGRDDEFFPYEHVLGTMLHELTHNKHGPHDAKFYKLLDEITKECEELMAKGITGTGEGFDGRGQRLGGINHNAPNMRTALINAAEQRAKRNAIMPGGARRLGGDTSMMQALSPVQAAAMAAERRLRDDLWCAGPDTTSSEGGAAKAAEREASSSPASENPSGPSTSAPGGASNRRGIREAETRAQEPLPTDKGKAKEGAPGTTFVEWDHAPWSCPVCTLENRPMALACDACGSERPRSARIMGPPPSKRPRDSIPTNKPSSSAQPSAGGSREPQPLPPPPSERERGMWTCKTCTLQNLSSASHCDACNEWRYSFGPPLAVGGLPGT